MSATVLKRLIETKQTWYSPCLLPTQVVASAAVYNVRFASVIDLDSLASHWCWIRQVFAE